MTDHPTRPDLDKWEALASEADYTGYTMFLPTPAEMRQMVAYVRHLQYERDVFRDAHTQEQRSALITVVRDKQTADLMENFRNIVLDTEAHSAGEE
jgi:hypothetical protein